MLALPEFGGKGDRILRDGQRDTVTRRRGDEETLEMWRSECGMRNLKEWITGQGDTEMR